MIKISCVMSVYNETEELVTRAIYSILKQTYPIKEFIIIIDNPNAKDLYKKVISIAERNSELDWQVIMNENNIGLPASLNKGISLAKNDYIARMDADDEALNNRIIDSVYLMERLGVDFVTTAVEVVDEQGNLVDKQRDYPHSVKGINKMGKYVSCVVHPTWLFNKRIWIDLGGYREELITAQDFDFQSRCLKKGFAIATTDSVGLKYTVRDNSISGSKRHIQSFLAAYIQNYVWNDKEFDKSIIDKIRSGQYSDFERFVKAFDGFFDAGSKTKRIKNLLVGITQSSYFRKFVRNVYIGKKYCNYYINSERINRRGE